MEIANVRLHLNKQGDDVPLKDVTPAQAMLLHVLHGPINGGKTFGEEFTKIEIVGQAMVETGKMVADKAAVVAVGKEGDANYKPAIEATFKKELRSRSDVEELTRLRKVYNGARDKHNKPIIDTIWPNRLKPELPQKFSDIKWQEVDATGIETAAVNYATGGLAKTTL